MDLVTSITGLEVEAVLADLKTVHRVRQRPQGEVETFTGKAGPQGDTEEVPITTDDCASVLFRFKGGARGSLWVSQTTAGRKNCLRYEIAGSEQALAWNSEEPNELWVGHRNSPNERLIRDSALLGQVASRTPTTPAGTTRGSPTRSSSVFGLSTRASSIPASPRSTRRSKRGMPRFYSARPL